MATGGPSQAPRRSPSARRVRHIRQALGMTQAEFAWSLRVDASTVRAWEAGRRAPGQLAELSIRNLAAIEGLDLHTMARFDAPQ